jgi:hypothetical protein
MAKTNRSEGQREKDRKRKEHAQKVLQKHGGVGGGGGDGSKRQKPSEDEEEAKSAFQELFTQRAQGFQIDFRFRNAPPRPPVGPCFVGSGLDGVLLDTSQYRPLNAVEVNYRWKLHSEPDLGVPLAPSAMDLKSYSPATAEPKMHPDDQALLEWTGPLGDTAAEELKKRKDNARASARLALMGKSPANLLEKAKAPVATQAATAKKAFSRVLDETMQSWMKKTTYLSNDYSRKVHDFKSLAKTKEELVLDLDAKQEHLSQYRSAAAIAKTFSQNTVPVRKHPSKKNLKPLMEMPLLPDANNWGRAYTHVVMDKSPGDVDKLGLAFVANVQKKDANARMTCQLFIPSEDPTRYQAIQQYDLDVLPLKDEDAPHVNFSICMDSNQQIATYLPISSRVQLSTGRPLKKKNYNMIISRRQMNDTDVRETEERIAEVDADVEERLKSYGSDGRSRRQKLLVDDSDDDSDQGNSFVNTTQTIVAEG